jgi:type VI secretion system protein ImpC
MAERFSRSSVHLDVTAGESPAHEVPASDTSFQILLASDFSGRGNRGLHSPLAGRRPLRVDVDNLDETMAEMKVALNLPGMTLEFHELDDFHPDRIYRRAEIFRRLEDARESPPKPKPPALQPGRSLLDQMIDADPVPVPAQPPGQPGDSLADFIEKAMAPHLEKSDPGKQQWSARVDAVAGEQMRAILHHEQFQAVEAAWRGAQMLVQRLNPDSELRIYLLDATLEELMDAPQEFAGILAASREPWALIAGNFTFGQSAQDASRLRTLGRMAASAGAPFLAEGQPPETEPGSDWTALRQSSEARWIGLALPRFLLRLPYGKDTSPVEALAFEEMPRSVHAHYLWGNPAWACALVLGEAFRNDGWDMRAGQEQITGLPLHFYKEAGESVAKPCGEILLTEHDADFLLENGLIPVGEEPGCDCGGAHPVDSRAIDGAGRAMVLSNRSLTVTRLSKCFSLDAADTLGGRGRVVSCRCRSASRR